MSDSDSDSDLQELLAAPGVYKEIEKPRDFINNTNLLKHSLERINKRLEWIERLDIVTGPAPPPEGTGLDNDVNKIDPNDDFKREAYFYRVAQAAVLEALPKLHELGIPTKRPIDYFAEMIKSDAHMVKVRENIVANKKRLELRERARQLREQRKFGKQQQKEILEARQKEKKQYMEALKAARKKPGGKDQAAILEEFLKSDATKKPKNRPTAGGKDGEIDRKYFRPKEYAKRRKVNHKRVFKNKVYGFGGQKKRSKRNDAESVRSGEKEVRVLTHSASAARIKKLGKRVAKATAAGKKGKSKKARK